MDTKIRSWEPNCGGGGAIAFFCSRRAKASGSFQTQDPRAWVAVQELKLSNHDSDTI